MSSKAKPKGSARNCPLCGQPTRTQFRPFCSKGCADRDLIAWVDGAYAIPVAEDEPEIPTEDDE